MKNYHIHILGQVQGVGFRPFIYKLMTSKNRKGYVNNTSKGVYIEIETHDPIEEIINEIEKQKPPLAKIEKIHFTKIPLKNFSEFNIIHSKENSDTNLTLTPDYALCEKCKNELFEIENKRYHYPFITCTNCGPRYSILQKIPYDRPFSTMQPFQQCSECTKEYENPLDRRYYSQTNSCPSCPVSLELIDSKTKKKIEKDQKEIVKWITQKIINKNVVAVKGIGGYLLLGDATDENVVKKIRKRKNRHEKPLALLMCDLQMIEKYAEITEKSKNELTQNIAPIILLKKKANNLPENIVFHHSQLGVMLPYTPLLCLIMNLIRFPLIATSANLSDSGIIYDQNQPSYDDLYQLADYILTNNREIVLPQDDSVIGFTSTYEKRIIYRRSRGLSPSLLNVNQPKEKKNMFALGADLKNTFGFWNGANLILSQYFGNMELYDIQREVFKTQQHILNLYKAKPEKLLVDKNDQFFSSQQTSLYPKIPIIKIQHHKAHFSAVLGDNRLLPLKEAVLGVIWDGVGLGEDHEIWGGEFFIANPHEITRVAHLKYYNHFLNDKMAKEPRLAAISLIKNKEKVQNKFSKVEYSVYLKKMKKVNLKTSSMGRLFDAVSSLLELTDYNQYEGHAATLLEREAQSFYYRNKEYNEEYASEVLDGQKLCELILEECTQGIDKQKIAFKFHLTLISWIENMAKKHELTKIAFSGGVFQNQLLVDLICRKLTEYEIFFHNELAPNDENIAYGQLMYASFYTTD